MWVFLVFQWLAEIVNDLAQKSRTIWQRHFSGGFEEGCKAGWGRKCSRKLLQYGDGKIVTAKAADLSLGLDLLGAVWVNPSYLDR